LNQAEDIPLIQVKTIAVLLIALACFARSPTSRAVDPPPDGGYPGFNTAEGTDALFHLTTGTFNTAVGFNALFSNTTGSGNTANGFRALFRNTIGNDNTASGSQALLSNTSGQDNTATGAFALSKNTSGQENTATGTLALSFNTVGLNNTATGEAALLFNTVGQNNTATGVSALLNNRTSDNNTATGFQALDLNTNGGNNTATGSNALFSNMTGNNNTATGVNALSNNIGGSFNTANGFQALFFNTGNDNTAYGVNALKNNTTGSRNIALGSGAGLNLTMGNDNIDIGNQGRADESGQIRIGTPGVQTATFIAGIRGVTVASGVAVVVSPNGQLGTMISSARYKDAVKPMDKASEAILALKAVTFHYKQEVDSEGIPQFGLIAEQVEKVNPDLVARDADGKVNTVRYEAVNAMLLNEFLKEHRKVQQLEKQVEKLAAGLEKVSARLQLSKPAPQTALNNQ
jgi:hypothetical protein